MNPTHTGYFTLIIGWECEGVGSDDYIHDLPSLIHEEDIPGWFYHYLDGNMACDNNRYYWLTPVQRLQYDMLYESIQDECTRFIKTRYIKLLPENRD